MLKIKFLNKNRIIKTLFSVCKIRLQGGIMQTKLLKQRVLKDSPLFLLLYLNENMVTYMVLLDKIDALIK